MLLLLCGDIEVNPGPKGMKICPQCKNFVGIKQNICKCGFKLGKKGRPLGTTKGEDLKHQRDDQLEALVLKAILLVMGALLVLLWMLDLMHRVGILLVQLSLREQKRNLVRMIHLNWQIMYNNMNYLLLGTQ